MNQSTNSQQHPLQAVETVVADQLVEVVVVDVVRPVGQSGKPRRITFKERAMLRFIQLGRQQQTATISFPDGCEDRAEEIFNKVITTEDLPEGETSEAALSLPNKIVHMAGKG